MGHDDDAHGMADTPENKRPRVDESAARQQQRTAFDEDMARIRAAMSSSSSNGNSNLSTQVTGGNARPHAEGGRKCGEGAAAATVHRGGGGGGLLEGGWPMPHAPVIPTESSRRNGPAAMGGASGGSDSEEEEGTEHWLKRYTPRHTRIGEKYQVVNLPSPAGHAPPAQVAPTACVSPGPGPRA